MNLLRIACDECIDCQLLCALREWVPTLDVDLECVGFALFDRLHLILIDRRLIMTSINSWIFIDYLSLK